ncbi:MFS family permease [Anaerosolibacter carboniphilus]|uniref:MFS family permease n=1 Tax=Anaerosolibacter carboniphilus TaxID=1417629 RepID=A0A841L0A6_9FIRM|nr:hypothetical protein [Anaerosolibacter carboniphilus]MBB6217640.1 MFS family permease [Anaerosolibacter carboniphilus]
MFSMELILAAFGGGILGALIGALPAFIFTGFVGLIGVAVIASGGPATILGDVVFGTLLGPHIAFAGGVAAAAYAANKKNLLASGGDILTPLKKTNDAGVILVGGIFGILGYVINSLYASIALPTDTVALTVFTSGVLARFIFGQTGLFGKYSAQGEVAAATELPKRSFVPDAKSLTFVALYSLGLGLVVSYLVDLTQINVLGFCISAALLIFAQMGFDMPATHHITLVAGYAAIATGNIFIGAAFAVISGILCEIVARTFNSYCDTHIDPPATTIFILSFIIFIFM